MRSLRTRLIFSHVLPILIVVPLVGLAAFLLLRLQQSLTTMDSGLQNQVARMEEQAQLTARAAIQVEALLSDPAAAQAFLQSMQLDVSRVTLLDPIGRVVATSSDGSEPAVDLALSAEDVAAIRSQDGILRVEVSGESGRKLAQIAIPILSNQQQTEGILLLTKEVGQIQSQFGNLSLLLVSIVIILFAMGIAIGLWLALRLSNSLQQVTEALEEMAHGARPSTLPAHDVREVDALYQSVNTLTDRLHALEDARKRLLANLVHELGRPLGSIRAAVHALRTGADSEPALRLELLGGIHAQIERMQPLLENLTQLHGQVLGSLELNRRETQISLWLTPVLALWREAAREKGVAWAADIPINLPAASIDSDQMARAVGNLLSNAVKYTPPGGSITVSARAQASLEPGEPAAVVITVADTGPGVPSADQRRIFEPFQRGGHERRFPQGLGLGLSIASDIAQAHGGSLQLESDGSTGSRFILTFPQ